MSLLAMETFCSRKSVIERLNVVLKQVFHVSVEDTWLTYQCKND